KSSLYSTPLNFIKTPLTKNLLTKDWQFRQTTALNSSTASSFLPVSRFSTVAHLDLLHHGLIKNPYIDINEIETLWVNDADWEYRTTIPSSVSSSTSLHQLVFEGLDTIYSIVFNGTVVRETRNMHIEHRVDATKSLKKGDGEENVLELKFKTAPEFAKKEKDRIGYKGNGTDVHFGGSERLFGWDWGPAINTSGPWKPSWDAEEGRIRDWIVRQEVSEDLKKAVVKIKGCVEGRKGSPISVEITDPEGKQVLIQDISVESTGKFSADIEVNSPQLPSLMACNRFTPSGSLSSADNKSIKLGFRRLRLLQHALRK
ncbi:Beta-mannosidase B, partial [Lachnellula occidentalis]